MARRTGVGVGALRAWERRHGILRPVRSASGQRLYSEDDVERCEFAPLDPGTNLFVCEGTTYVAHLR